MGLGGALFEAIEFDDGKILNPRFSKYRVPRFGDMPQIEVVLVDRKDLPSAGAGETPIVGIAPAVAMRSSMPPVSVADRCQCWANSRAVGRPIVAASRPSGRLDPLESGSAG